jgi:hypothetical protein
MDHLGENPPMVRISASAPHHQSLPRMKDVAASMHIWGVHLAVDCIVYSALFHFAGGRWR